MQSLKIILNTAFSFSLFLNSAFAQDISVRAENSNYQYQMGLMAGETAKEFEAAFILGGSGLILNPKSSSEELKGMGKYTSGNLRLEIGNSAGLYWKDTSGYKIMGRRDGEHFYPTLAVEPFNLNFSLNFNHEREDYIEWTPSIAAGFEIAAGKCALLGLAKVGGAFGTLGWGGVRAVNGAGAYFQCPKVEAVAEFSKIRTETSEVEINNVDLALPAPGRNAMIGVRGEAIVTHEEKTEKFFSMPRGIRGDNVEKRALITYRGTF